MNVQWPLRKSDFDAAHARRKEFRALLAERHRSANLDAHEIVFGELIANAVRYGDEPIVVAVAVTNGTVQIRVENAGECFDLDRRLATAPESTATNGRGLQIVRALADTLTVEHVSFSCRVTATLRLLMAAS